MSAVLRVEALSKRFGGIVVADAIALEIAGGEILGLIGPNGAGKTSLFNLVSGIVTPDAGAVYLHDRPITGLAVHRRARLGLSRTWQNMRLFTSMSVIENLLIAPREYAGESIVKALFRPPSLRRADREARERAEAVLERIQLAEARHRLVSALPFGQQKLVGLGRALMNDGRCLLLDEPMAGVEGSAYETMRRVVREEAQAGRAVCVIEHNISFIKDLCDRAVFMFNGRIIKAGTVGELLASEELRQLYFGSES